jgi:hypothetical protein
MTQKNFSNWTDTACFRFRPELFLGESLIVRRAAKEFAISLLARLRHPNIEFSLNPRNGRVMFRIVTDEISSWPTAERIYERIRQLLLQLNIGEPPVFEPYSPKRLTLFRRFWRLFFECSAEECRIERLCHRRHTMRQFLRLTHWFEKKLDQDGKWALVRYSRRP